jgi:alanine racemase
MKYTKRNKHTRKNKYTRKHYSRTYDIIPQDEEYILPEYKNITATIDANAIRHNIDYLRKVSKTDVMPVLKSNAYGHGIVPVSRILRSHNVKMIGVATIGEALMLRKHGDTGHIVAWLYDINSKELKDAIQKNIDISVIDQKHIPTICKLAADSGKKVRIHIFADTGIDRAAVPYSEVIHAAIELSSNPHIELVGLMSHFIQSEFKNDATTKKQLRLFRELIDILSKKHNIHFKYTHIANSGGCLNYDVSDFTLARPGLAIYGLDPSGKYNKNLQPAMTITSRIIQKKHISKGAVVGYDNKYIAKKGMEICIAPIGYADIIPRSSSGKLYVYINGTKRKVLGNISMDQIVIESKPVDKVGDEVLLFGAPHKGAKQTAYDVAKVSKTITDELVVRTNATNRVHRKYLNYS